MREEERREKLLESGFAPSASADELRNFINGSVWADLRDYFETKVILYRDLLEDEATPELDTKLIRARLAVVREFLALPEAMQAEMLALAEEEKNNAD